MKEDLHKAEQRWAQRRLFAPKPRRRWWWLWLLLLVVIALLFYGMGTGPITGVMHMPLG